MKTGEKSEAVDISGLTLEGHPEYLRLVRKKESLAGKLAKAKAELTAAEANVRSQESIAGADRVKRILQDEDPEAVAKFTPPDLGKAKHAVEIAAMKVRDIEAALSLVGASTDRALEAAKAAVGEDSLEIHRSLVRRMVAAENELLHCYTEEARLVVYLTEQLGIAVVAPQRLFEPDDLKVRIGYQLDAIRKLPGYSVEKF